jgi:hypothetical protein
MDPQDWNRDELIIELANNFDSVTTPGFLEALLDPGCLNGPETSDVFLLCEPLMDALVGEVVSRGASSKSCCKVLLQMVRASQRDDDSAWDLSGLQRLLTHSGFDDVLVTSAGIMSNEDDDAARAFCALALMHHALSDDERFLAAFRRQASVFVPPFTHHLCGMKPAVVSPGMYNPTYARGLLELLDVLTPELTTDECSRVVSSINVVLPLVPHVDDRGCAPWARLYTSCRSTLMGVTTRILDNVDANGTLPHAFMHAIHLVMMDIRVGAEDVSFSEMRGLFAKMVGGEGLYSTEGCTEAVIAARFAPGSAHLTEVKKAERILKVLTDEFCTFCARRRGGLRRCARCRIARYCSPDCNQKGWREHKKFCKPC